MFIIKKIKPLLLKYILIILFNILFSQTENYNLDLIFNIEIQNASNNFGVSDVWGYTDEAGNEYAIVGYKSGTKIYNVSSNQAEEILDLPGPSGSDYYFHRDFKTFNNHLFIVNEMYGADEGMQVVDLSPLPNTEPIYRNTYEGIAQSHNLWISDNGYAYIEHYYGDNIHIVDVNNPLDIIYEATFGNLGENCHDVYTQGNLAYVSEGYSNQYGIYDISDLNNINKLATIDCIGYAHNAWTNIAGTHLVTTEETQGISVKIWDITDLNNINMESEYLGQNGLAHNVHVKDDLVYISHYTAGVKIIDIFDPTDPIEVASYDTYPQNDNEGFYGCWGAFPFTENGYVYASDMQNGLFVLDFNQSVAGWVEGYIYDEFNNPISDAKLVSKLNNKIFYTDNNGKFYFGFPEGEQLFDVVVEEQIISTQSINIAPHQLSYFDLYPYNNQLLYGDINQDSVIDILDVVLEVNIIMGIYNPSVEELNLADLNFDDVINVQDIILMINIILQL